MITVPAPTTSLDDLKKAERARVQSLKDDFWDFLLLTFGVTDPAKQGVPQMVTYLFRQLCDGLDLQMAEAFAKLEGLQSLTEETVDVAKNLATTCANGDTVALMKFVNELAEIRKASGTSPA